MNLAEQRREAEANARRWQALTAAHHRAKAAGRTLTRVEARMAMESADAAHHGIRYNPAYGYADARKAEAAFQARRTGTRPRPAPILATAPRGLTLAGRRIAAELAARAARTHTAAARQNPHRPPTLAAMNLATEIRRLTAPGPRTPADHRRLANRTRMAADAAERTP